MASSVQEWTTSATATGDTGNVTFDEYGVGLITGSPAWAGLALVVPEPSNFVRLSYRFEGTGTGSLAAYLNGELILLADERAADGAEQDSGVLYIGPILNDANWLTVRLDPLDREQASVWISNIEYGISAKIGDFDADRAVDLRDMAVFQRCYAGESGTIPVASCSLCDLDDDQDVELHDFTLFWVTTHNSPPDDTE